MVRLAIAALAGLVVGPAAVHAAPASAPACERPARVFAAGREGASLCPSEAGAAGLTTIDLSDAWVPFPFEDAATAQGRDAPAYRDTLIELENLRPGDDALATSDGDFELYGIAPSPRIVLTALSDEARHRCHDIVDDAALTTLAVPLRHEDPARADARRDELTRLRARLDVLRTRHGDAELAARPAHARMLRREQTLAAIAGAIAATQEHLVCEGLLPASKRRGAFDYATMQALARYQRRHWIVAGGELDEDTRAALTGDSRELDYRRALRVLRQRVADAAGLIEDGSARGEWGTVFGRPLDGAMMRYQGGHAPLPGGAPDRISLATEAAASALGWRDPTTTRDSLKRLLADDVRPVAVALPPAPNYHRRPLELRAVIDRGDVAKADPRSARGQALARKVTRRPVLILYARDGASEIPLVRWPTTIGGWKDEKLRGGAVVRRYKPSDVGPRVWRDLLIAPVWYAPESTPDDELIGVRDGRWTVKDDLIGPSYRSAYGLAMLIHHEAVERRDGTHYIDHGIRTHGSVTYRSILTGTSHGCHRLYNHHALRLATFLLRYRDHVVRGPDAEVYARRVRGHGRSWTIHREARGYRYELTPPVQVDVLAGTVLRACES